MKTRVAGVLLAAGEGSRLGQPKALVEFGGQTLAERGVAMLRDGGADPLVLVTGAARASAEGARTVRNLDWRTGMGSSLAAGLYSLETIEQDAADRAAFNGEPIDWAIVDRKARRSTVQRSTMQRSMVQGSMVQGVAAGPAALPGDGVAPAEGRIVAAIIALADQPLVGAESVKRLIDAFAAGATVAVAAYDGKPRNPVLIGREHWPTVVDTAVGDVGARPFLRSHPHLVTLVECGDIGSPADIDTTEDLARIAALEAGQRRDH